jgi:hypothetical protein
LAAAGLALFLLGVELRERRKAKKMKEAEKEIEAE